MTYHRQLLLPLLLLTACVQTHFYEPTLALGPSQATIPAAVRIEKFMDATPSNDNRGHSPTAQQNLTLKSSLADLVSEAVREDFHKNHVFGSIQWTEEQPDYVLTGKIYRFSGKHEWPWWAPIPGVNLLVATFSDSHLGYLETEVDIGLTLQALRGTVVRQYRARVPLREPQALSWAIGQEATIDQRLATQLNQNFSVAIGQLRDQLTRDPALAVSTQ